jgi:hypothetical protein
VPAGMGILTIPKSLKKFYLAAGRYQTSQSYYSTENGCWFRSQFLCLPISLDQATPFLVIGTDDPLGNVTVKLLSYGRNML